MVGIGGKSRLLWVKWLNPQNMLRVLIEHVKVSPSLYMLIGIRKLK